MNVVEILKLASQKQASDVFIVVGSPVCLKVGSSIKPIDENSLIPNDTSEYLKQIYELQNNRSMKVLLETGDDDFSFSIKGLGRFRCNAYKQRGSLAAVLRLVALELPDYQCLNIPESVMNLYQKSKGLVLVTGPAGSGKSTTLSLMIDKINSTRNSHIITIEDPIEFLHKHKLSLVSQREVSQDTDNYVQALRAALRQAPNVILLGEMRDYETIATAMTAAETGQLVFSTLHTVGAANTIDRIIDVFPSNQQQQVRFQLSMVLEAVVSQQLIPTVDGKLMPVFEIMKVNSAIRNLIRESKIHQIDNVIFASSEDGMTNMDTEIFKLYREGIITKENAISHCLNLEVMQRKIAD
ncbi:PilT/PilU family type 4a pilus ATPase [Paludicola sp. MB14-C6]|uniref:type IV pilus twitching motility protein PilT n=1 Tax=Paludihabitans sp. MB14-C6 TaxID=3070656 RepID=UPI0027DDEDAF|nr:PilT/PilU family type 4a pilus ATPase [Paludicola sp. MB14-C6]WMJ22326.1 PilT/PilU family type 4a pilus ATPase [Paludicola sp. MB14-C6]